MSVFPAPRSAATATLNQSGGTTREARKTRTRARLKEAALAAFAEHGYAEASIADITRAAAVAQGTFYVHFSGKEAVLDELLADFNRGLVEAFGAHDFAAPLGFGGDLRPLVAALAGTFLDYWATQRQLVLVFAQRAAAGLRVEELRDGINPGLHGFLVEMLAARGGDADRGRLSLVAHGLLALWLRLGMQWLLGGAMSAADRRHFPELLADMTVGMLEAALPDLRPGRQGANPNRQGGRR